MKKPITIRYEEFKNGMVNLINNSDLQTQCGKPTPLAVGVSAAFVIEATLQSYLNETKIAVKRQYKIDKIQYNNTINNENNKV